MARTQQIDFMTNSIYVYRFEKDGEGRCYELDLPPLPEAPK